jgi:glycosyltransferase involved in cell wall biosynthesis
MVQVSVIIPTYQSAKYIKSAVESVLAQTFKDFEIIVVDGGSTDDTRKIAESYGSKIRLLLQNGRGISNARNIGVAAAKGEYIAFLDSDDLWVTTKLERQLEFIKVLNLVGLVYSDGQPFFEERVRTKVLGTLFDVRKPRRGNITKELLVENFIPCSTVLIRKLCFQEIGNFDESLSLCEDHDLWLRVSKVFCIDYQPVVLAKLRSRSGSLSTNLERLLITQIALRKRTIGEMPALMDNYTNEFLAKLFEPLLNLGLFYLSSNNALKARIALKEYLKWCPANRRTYFFILVSHIPYSSKLLRLFKNLRYFFMMGEAP